MTSVRARWPVVLLPLVIVVGGALLVYGLRDGASGDVEPGPACQNLSEYSGKVAPEKLEPLKVECDAAKASLASAEGAPNNPAIVTPVPGNPPSPPPCDQWNPSIAPGCIFYGILEGRQPPLGYERTYQVRNSWAGTSVIVYAGALYDDGDQGLVVAVERDFESSENRLLGEFRTGSKEGALRIVSEDGTTLHLVSSLGTEYSFDVAAMSLSPK